MTFPAPIFAAQSADLSLQKSCASPGGFIVKGKLYLSLTIISKFILPAKLPRFLPVLHFHWSGFRGK